MVCKYLFKNKLYSYDEILHLLNETLKEEKELDNILIKPLDDKQDVSINRETDYYKDLNLLMDIMVKSYFPNINILNAESTLKNIEALKNLMKVNLMLNQKGISDITDKGLITKPFNLNHFKHVSNDNNYNEYLFNNINWNSLNKTNDIVTNPYKNENVLVIEPHTIINQQISETDIILSNFGNTIKINGNILKHKDSILIKANEPYNIEQVESKELDNYIIINEEVIDNYSVLIKKESNEIIEVDESTIIHTSTYNLRYLEKGALVHFTSNLEVDNIKELFRNGYNYDEHLNVWFNPKTIKKTIQLGLFDNSLNDSNISSTIKDMVKKERKNEIKFYYTPTLPLVKHNNTYYNKTLSDTNFNQNDVVLITEGDNFKEVVKAINSHATLIVDVKSDINKKLKTKDFINKIIRIDDLKFNLWINPIQTNYIQSQYTNDIYDKYYAENYIKWFNKDSNILFEENIKDWNKFVKTELKLDNQDGINDIYNQLVNIPKLESKKKEVEEIEKMDILITSGLLNINCKI